MADALVGYTGFVGSNLDCGHAFAGRFNSKNFAQMKGATFDLVVCAAVSAAKWLANREPQEDARKIRELTDVLDTMVAREFVLISTIDVYPNPALPSDELTAIDPDGNHAYGRNRYLLEQWVVRRFDKARIIRLPALFGRGLKKNALYDLLHDNQVDKINPRSAFQWYPLERLWGDIRIAQEADLRLTNLFPEPLPMRAIIDAFFPGAPVGPETDQAACYQVRSRYAQAFGGRDGFIMPAGLCLKRIGEFVASHRDAEHR